MANPNNLIRPPVLPSPNPNPAQPDLANQVRELLGQLLLTDGRNIIQSIIKNDMIPAPIVDQTIDERYRNNLSDMDKIPDVVRSLREFSGNPTEFSSWRKSVERILKIYENLIGTPKYFGILNVIRNKIVGKADAVLESYNTPLNWTAISKCLTTHYADKRDLSTLEYQMTCIIQGRRSVQSFYSQVYAHLSLILNKIACMEMSEESIQILSRTYREKALDTFVRGLSGDLSKLLGMKEPADLPEALHLCMKLENQNFRTTHANNYNTPYRMDRPQLPPKPQHQHFQRQVYTQPSQQYFHPELAYMPRTQQAFSPNAHRPQQFVQRTYQPFNSPQYNTYNNPQYNPYNNPPPRPLAQKPLPKPEPMDIDQSIRTNAINYANRPNFKYAGKRQEGPSSNFTNPPHKIQRNFHINCSQIQPEGPNSANPLEEPTYHHILDQDSLNYNQNQPEILDPTDIHFLE
uniref:Retrovirus-related Gag polyprotein from transposon HMS-Beagle n=1 Tax=Bactrocera dorsalis TaxID=27457 RepID=A0A034VZ85_BACDO